jgi:CubicO group peptidase (beta-lactamase class C family)
MLAAAVATGLLQTQTAAQERRIITGGQPGPQLSLPALELPDADLSGALDAWLKDLAAKDLFSGVLILAHDGDEVLSAAYGFADREAQTPAALDTSFNLASIGKAFTQAAVAQLIESGFLSLQDTVGDWLPDYPNAITKSATIEQLLEHSGGVADFFGPSFDDLPKENFNSNAAFYEYVSQQAPLFSPGEKQEYCNGCYVVLGEIIAAATGMSYEAYVAENVFWPAGMTGVWFTEPVSVARSYGKRPDGAFEDVSTMRAPRGSAAGGSFGTAADILAFDRALRGGVLGERAKSLVLRDRGVSMIGGGSAGVNTLLMGDGEWTIVVLANLDPPIAQEVGEAVFEQVGRQ